MTVPSLQSKPLKDKILQFVVFSYLEVMTFCLTLINLNDSYLRWTLWYHQSLNQKLNNSILKTSPRARKIFLIMALIV